MWLTKPRYLLSSPLQKKFANPWFGLFHSFGEHRLSPSPEIPKLHDSWMKESWSRSY